MSGVRGAGVEREQGAEAELGLTTSPFARVLLFYQRFRRSKLDAADLVKVSAEELCRSLVLTLLRSQRSTEPQTVKICFKISPKSTLGTPSHLRSEYVCTHLTISLFIRLAAG